MNSTNETIQYSIEKLRELNKGYIKHTYDDDELEYLNDYATKYDVEQPFFRNIDVIEETISDLVKQPEWLQLILHKFVVEVFEDNGWTMVNKRVNEIEDATVRLRVNIFLDIISGRSWTSKSRYEMAKKLLKNYE